MMMMIMMIIVIIIIIIQYQFFTGIHHAVDGAFKM